MSPVPDPGGESRHDAHREIVDMLTEITELLTCLRQSLLASPACDGRSAPSASCKDWTGRLGGRAVPTSTSPPHIIDEISTAVRLTGREEQILAILLTGASNRLIARSLGLAERTVKNALHSIYRKLGVVSRTEAVAMVLGHPERAIRGKPGLCRKEHGAQEKECPGAGESPPPGQ